MTRTSLVWTPVAVGLAIASVGWIAGFSPDIGELAVLIGLVATGEFYYLKPAGRASLPCSLALVPVVVTLERWELVLIVCLGEGGAVALRVLQGGLIAGAQRFAERCAAIFAAAIIYRLILGPGTTANSALTLLAFAGAAILPIVVTDLVGYAKGEGVAALSSRSADVAIASTGVLMAVGFTGVNGSGGIGLWGPALFSIPLVAAWYSFELLGSTQKSFDQTVLALAAAPELGGLVREGHAGRVAELALGMGEVLGLSPSELEQLKTASLLHHLGVVCLDEPGEGESLDPVEVSNSGASMLRASEALSGAGDIVAAEPLLHRPPGQGDASAAALSGMILKVASAYDELTEGTDEHATWAVEALYTGPGYVYDGRVLSALERILAGRGALVPR